MRLKWRYQCGRAQPVQAGCASMICLDRYDTRNRSRSALRAGSDVLPGVASVTSVASYFLAAS
ncbi:hypothetical protein SBV1_210018 [Verrucomicrobia bacterium]|nr:hypothetical protein SBV1_210018 [Verrucomicrobiota bacterium]